MSLISNKDRSVVAAKSPAEITLEAIKGYFWCRSGKSKSQPLSDGSDRGTSMTLLKFSAEISGDVSLCQWKSSSNAPFCDGTHASRWALSVGDEHLHLTQMMRYLLLHRHLKSPPLRVFTRRAQQTGSPRWNGIHGRASTRPTLWKIKSEFLRISETKQSVPALHPCVSRHKCIPFSFACRFSLAFIHQYWDSVLGWFCPYDYW